MTYPTYVFTFRGIGENIKGNLMIDALPLPAGAQRVEVEWAASYGPVPDLFGISYAAALAAGMALGEAKVREVLRRQPFARIVLVGYSGGAALAGDLAAKLGPSLVDAVVLIADPNDPGAGGVCGLDQGEDFAGEFAPAEGEGLGDDDVRGGLAEGFRDDFGAAGPDVLGDGPAPGRDEAGIGGVFGADRGQGDERDGGVETAGNGRISAENRGRTARRDDGIGEGRSAGEVPDAP